MAGKGVAWKKVGVIELGLISFPHPLTSQLESEFLSPII
jgi:hypothetical protein